MTIGKVMGLRKVPLNWGSAKGRGSIVSHQGLQIFFTLMKNKS